MFIEAIYCAGFSNNIPDRLSAYFCPRSPIHLHICVSTRLLVHSFIYIYMTRVRRMNMKHHLKETPQHVQRHVEASSAAASEERRHGETGANGGEVVIGVHGTAVG